LTLAKRRLTQTDSHLVYLSLGSNIPPRRQFIKKSVELLEGLFPADFSCSSLYVTRPFQRPEQKSYINAALQCSCDLDPLEMLSVIGDMETSMGRRRGTEKWESRTIDIDILLWGASVIKKPQLTIPHYDLSNRDFFLVPLLELNSALVHPETGVPLRQLLATVPDHLRTYPESIGSCDALKQGTSDD